MKYFIFFALLMLVSCRNDAGEVKDNSLGFAFNLTEVKDNIAYIFNNSTIVYMEPDSLKWENATYIDVYLDKDNCEQIVNDKEQNDTKYRCYTK